VLRRGSVTFEARNSKVHRLGHHVRASASANLIIRARFAVRRLPKIARACDFLLMKPSLKALIGTGQMHLEARLV
jgi:hypothetical protein